MIKTLMFVAAAVLLASAVDDEPEVINRAIVLLQGDGVTGNITFTKQDNGNVCITGTVTGMPPGMYGFHIHEKGDITHGCGSTLAHFNPNGKDHGHPDDENRHVGDLGNVHFDASNTAILDICDHLIKLNGRHSIIGRGVVLHAMADDFGRSDHPDSKKTGNAGGRVACGVIGILDSTPPARTSAASMSTSNILVTLPIYSLILTILY